MSREQEEPEGSGDGSPRRGASGAAHGRSAPRPAPRAQPASIALRMEEVAAWVIGRAGGFPREHRFTLGERMVQASLDALEALTEAAYRRDKLPSLAAADRALVRLRVLARLAERFQCLSHAQLAHLARESVEVGRMLGGWTRQQREAGRGTPPAAVLAPEPGPHV